MAEQKCKSHSDIVTIISFTYLSTQTPTAVITDE